MMMKYPDRRVQKDFFTMPAQFVIEYQVFLRVILSLKQAKLTKNPLFVRYITCGNVTDLLPGSLRKEFPELRNITGASHQIILIIAVLYNTADGAISRMVGACNSLQPVVVGHTIRIQNAIKSPFASAIPMFRAVPGSVLSFR